MRDIDDAWIERRRHQAHQNRRYATKAYKAWAKRGGGSLLGLKPVIALDEIGSAFSRPQRALYIPTVLASRHEVDGRVHVMRPGAVIVPHVYQLRSFGGGPMFEVWPAPESMSVAASRVYETSWHPVMREVLAAIDRFFQEKNPSDETIRAILRGGREWDAIASEGLPLPATRQPIKLPKMNVVVADLRSTTRRPIELL